MLLLDSALIAGLIFVFARHNAEGGLLYSFLALFGALIVSVLIVVALPDEFLFLATPIYLVILAAALTFVCGTRPKQTAKIIGSFLLIRIAFGGATMLLSS